MTTACSRYIMVDAGAQDETCTGACTKACLYVPSQYNNLSSKMCDDIRTIEDPKVREQSMGFCNTLCQSIYHFNKTSLPNDLPQMYFSDDDGDAFFEWIFDNFRFGFLFCQDDDESGWYLLSKSDGKITRFRSKYRGRETIDYILTYIGTNA